MEKPTEKQVNRVKKIEEYLGKEEVLAYFKKFFPSGEYNDMTKKQAQKIISGMGTQVHTFVNSKYKDEPNAYGKYVDGPYKVGKVQFDWR